MMARVRAILLVLALPFALALTHAANNSANPGLMRLGRHPQTRPAPEI